MRDLHRLFPKRTIMQVHTFPKMSQDLQIFEHIAKNFWLFSFLPFYNFSANASLAAIRGTIVFTLAAVAVWGGWSSGRRLVLNGTRLKYATADFFFSPSFPTCTYLLVWVYLWMYLLVCMCSCLARLSCRLLSPIPSSSVCSIWPLWWRVKGNDRPFEDALVPASWIMQRVKRAGSQRKLQSLSASPVSLGERLQCCGEIRPTPSGDLVKLN